MRIALIHFRLRHLGGLERRLLNYARHLHAQGHEVTLIVGRRYRGVTLPKGVRVRLLWVAPWHKFAQRQIVFSRKVAAHMQRHSYDFSLSLGRTVGQDAVLAAGTHLGYLAAQSLQPQGMKDDGQILMDKRSFDESRHIFACSEMIAQEVIRLYDTDPEKVHVLLPPLQVAAFPYADAAAREQARQTHGLQAGVFTCLFVSLSHGRKGLPLLLEVFRKLDPARFRLLIAGEQADTASLPHVQNLGYVRSMASLYAAADLTLHPAVYEPFGQLVSESLAVGTPVLVSHQVGAACLVGPQQGRVVTGWDAADWEQAILQLADAPLRVPPGIADAHDLSTEAHLNKMLNTAMNNGQ